MTKAKRYSPPRTQAARIVEANGHIASLTATMNVGRNMFGEYGRNCRDSIKRWEATIADARAQIAAGIVKV